MGEVPLKWYGEEGHIGYDREANKLAKKDKSQLEAGLKDKDRWRTIYDEYNDEQITLSKEEIEMITRIRQGRFPHVEVCLAWFSESLVSSSKTILEHRI